MLNPQAMDLAGKTVQPRPSTNDPRIAILALPGFTCLYLPLPKHPWRWQNAQFSSKTPF
jgi:hypothetical protein